jgi:hypothetical protein
MRKTAIVGDQTTKPTEVGFVYCRVPNDDLLSHGGIHTIIGVPPFHRPVRDGKGWGAKRPIGSVGRMAEKGRVSAINYLIRRCLWVGLRAHVASGLFDDPRKADAPQGTQASSALLETGRS